MFFPTAAEAFTPGAIIKDFLWTGGPSTATWVFVFVIVVAVLNIAGIRPYGAVEVDAHRRDRHLPADHRADRPASVSARTTRSTRSSRDVDLTWEPVLHPARDRDLHLRRDGVHLPARRGDRRSGPQHPARDLPRAHAREHPGRPLRAGRPRATCRSTSSLTFSPRGQMDAASVILGDTGKWWMALVSIAATLSTLNALVAGIPRILYGMGLTGQLPRVFSYLLPSTRAPGRRDRRRRADADLDQRLEGPRDGLRTSSSSSSPACSAGRTAYIIIHLTVLILRRTSPNAKRPFRSSWVPIPQLVGSALIILAAWKIFPVEDGPATTPTSHYGDLPR